MVRKMTKKELKQLEKEASQAFKQAMRDVQPDLRWSERQQKRAEEILKDMGPQAPGPCLP